MITPAGSEYGGGSKEWRSWIRVVSSVSRSFSFPSCNAHFNRSELDLNPVEIESVISESWNSTDIELPTSSTRHRLSMGVKFGAVLREGKVLSSPLRS